MINKTLTPSNDIKFINSFYFINENDEIIKFFVEKMKRHLKSQNPKIHVDEKGYIEAYTFNSRKKERVVYTAISKIAVERAEAYIKDLEDNNFSNDILDILRESKYIVALSCYQSKKYDRSEVDYENNDYLISELYSSMLIAIKGESFNPEDIAKKIKDKQEQKEEM